MSEVVLSYVAKQAVKCIVQYDYNRYAALASFVFGFASKCLVSTRLLSHRQVRKLSARRISIDFRES